MSFSTKDFNGNVLKEEVAQQLAVAVIEGSPFAGSIPNRNISGGTYITPVVTTVNGDAWVAEGADIPDLTAGTSSEIRVTRKLAGIAMLTSEMIEDADFPVFDELRNVLQGTLSRDLDTGLLSGDPKQGQPDGIIPLATATAGTSLVACTAAAIGELGEAGGKPDTIALSPTTIAQQLAITEAATGRPAYPNGLADMLGLHVVSVPGLTDSLVYDAAGMKVVLSRGMRVDLSRDYAPAYKSDQIAARFTCRVNLSCPVPGKTIRKLTIKPPAK
jgi:HK97 family phage major capsid protein